MTLLAYLALCLPWTIDSLSDGIATVETACAYVHIPAQPWMREGMTTDPWRADRIERRYHRLPRAPRGDMSL